MASRRPNRWSGKGVLLALVLLLLPTSARADDGDAKAKLEKAKAQSEQAVARYAREQLVRRALESVRPDRMEEDGVGRMRDEVKERREEFLAIHRPSIEQADDLIDGDAGRGLIGEAARLYAWMAHVPAPPSVDPAALITAPDLRYPVIVYKGTEQRPDLGALVTQPDEASLPADKKATLELARRQVSARLRSKRLDVLRRPSGLIDMGSSGITSLDLALDTIRSGKTTEKEDGTSVPATWIALTDRHELFSRMSRTYVAAREIQVRERLAAYTADMAPSGLVSERAVEEKAEHAEVLQADVEALSKRRDAMDESLDWLVWAERELTSELGTLGYALEDAKAALAAEEKAAKEAAEAEAKAEAERKAKEEEARKKAEEEAKSDKGKGSPKDGEAKKDDGAEPPKGGDDDAGEGGDDAGGEDAGGEDAGGEDAGTADEAAQRSAAETKLIALQLQEGVLKLKMRLLYLTVHRAVLRRQLYDRAIELAKEEARAAQDVAQRYRSELNRMRRERQLEVLDYEETKLELLLTDATSRADDPEHENRPLWLLWKQALESLRNMNRLTKEAVKLRRAFESKLSPGRANGEEPPAAEKTEGDDPLRRFRHPERVVFDEKYVEDARQALADPAFDMGLVARHHEVVSDRIAALQTALSFASDDRRIETELKAQAQAAEKALSDLLGASAKLPDPVDTGHWRETVTETRKRDYEPTRKAYEETLRGLDAKAKEVRSLLASATDLERELRDLGTRSFGIRVQRDLDGEKLGEAFDDMQDTAGGVGRWVSGEGEHSVVTFARENWAMLLACLAFVAASVFFVRFTRRGLDRAIGSIARSVPQLRTEPVTVRAEEAHAKREKAEQELAAKEAEAEALRMVSKEEAGKAQRMGEGGVS